jgi:predicted transcriptional regulator
MGKSVRTTFSLPAEQHSELLRIADDSHVSTAWVVREAVRLYLAERYPLLQETGKEHTMGETEKNDKRQR